MKFLQFIFATTSAVQVGSEESSWVISDLFWEMYANVSMGDIINVEIKTGPWAGRRFQSEYEKGYNYDSYVLRKLEPLDEGC